VLGVVMLRVTAPDLTGKADFLICIENIIYLFTKQATLVRRSTVEILPPL